MLHVYGPFSPSKQGLALDGKQSRGQEAIDKLDQTSGPSSSHLAQPSGGVTGVVITGN